MIATKRDEVLMSNSIRLLSALMALFFLGPVNSAQATGRGAAQLSCLGVEAPMFKRTKTIFIVFLVTYALFAHGVNAIAAEGGSSLYVPGGA